jgi:hypothetical protein
LELSIEHLTLGFWIEPDVTDDHAPQQFGSNELANSDARRRRVVGNDCEIAFSLPDDLVDDGFGRADAHEAADHQTRPRGYHLDGIMERNHLHGCLLAVQAFMT